LIQDTTGFFILEAHVRDTAGDFRAVREVEELWDAVGARLMSALRAALSREGDPDVYLEVKEMLLAFVTTLEVSLFSQFKSKHSRLKYPSRTRTQQQHYETSSWHALKTMGPC
jgi:hypothetical protein